ncbi:MAG: antibiotic biosynthesis monooxygenase [Cyclobacteriaceae bacterium]
MSNQIAWVLQLDILEGQLDAFKTLMNEMVDATQSNEPDTLGYEWWISDDNSSCHIYERYTNSEAVMVHLTAFGAFAERFMSCASPTGFTVYGNPDETVKAALTDFGPNYMGALGGYHR